MPNSAVTANANAPIARAAGTAGAMVDQITGITNANNVWSAQQAAEQRKWQEEQTQKVMDYNSAEAVKNRDWQEMMSNTAHQREIKDLQAAGLNPVLSATGGQGAAVGSGASAAASAPSGAKGDTDTSGASALVGMMSSLINAQVQLANANLSAVTNMATTDKYTEASKYAAELGATASKYGADVAAETARYTAQIGASTQLSTANIHAAAQRYAAEVGASAHLGAAQISAGAQTLAASIHAAAQKYGYDVQSMTSKEIAAFNAQVNEDLQKEGFRHDFDIKQAFPGNAWEYNAGQANARAWVDSVTGGFRNVFGSGGIGGLIGSFAKPFGK